MTFYTDGLTDVAVANMALSKIGARSTISSLSENSPEGRLVRLWLSIARAQTLQAYNWSFARKRKALTLSSDIPDGTDMLWEYKYNYVTDALAVREIWNPGGPDLDAIEFDTEFNSDRTAKVILTNMEDAVGIFTIDVPELQSWPALAIEALTTCLAWHIALPITGDEQKADKMAAQFRYIIATAAAHDGNESIKRAPRDAESIRARQ